MTTIRVARRKRYVQVDRRSVNDTTLSFRARGVLQWLLDKPDDWTINAEAISRHGAEGRDAIRSALGELRDAGYLVTRRWRGDHGRWMSESTLYEHPAAVDNDRSGFPAPVDPQRRTSAGESGLVLKTGQIPVPTPPPSPGGDDGDAVQRIFKAWAESTANPVALDGARLQLILRRLGEYDEVDLVAAVQGWKFSPWHRGQNPSGRVYNSLELVLRSPQQVEMFRDLFLAGTVATQVSLFADCAMCDGTGRRYDEPQNLVVPCECRDIVP